MSKQNKGIWQLRRAELEVMAKTMTSGQMGMHYGVARRRMTHVLGALGIKAHNPKNVWAERIDELRELCKTMTCSEIARHYKLSMPTMCDVFRKYEISPVKSDRKKALRDYGEQLKKLAKTMSANEAAMKLGRNPQSVRDYANRHGFKFQTQERRCIDYWIGEKEKIATMHKTMFARKIAEYYGISDSRMRTVMTQLGIEIGRISRPESSKKQEKQAKKQVAKKQQIEQKKEWKPPVKAVYDIVFPKGVKVQQVKRSTSDDPRCVMSAPIYNPHARTVSARY